MPIFEYQCDKCHKIEEELEMHKTESHHNLFCPNCKDGVMKKIISTSVIIDRVNLRIPLAGNRQRKKIK